VAAPHLLHEHHLRVVVPARHARRGRRRGQVAPGLVGGLGGRALTRGHRDDWHLALLVTTHAGTPARLSTGSTTRKVLPRPSSLSTRTVPPISSTYSLTMARPSPALRPSPVRDGSAR